MVAAGFELIGKEADRVGESGEADPARSAVEKCTDLAVCSNQKDSDNGPNSAVDELLKNRTWSMKREQVIHPARHA